VGRALDLFGIDSGLVQRWGEDIGPSTANKNSRSHRAPK
jgi:hypothetical protein